jgi:Zn-dependent membrane protease YugP
MGGLFVIMIVMSLIGGYISNQLKNKFGKYSHMPTSSGMTGKEIAEDMLAYYGITDVKVLSAKGFLTDHYNPADKTVNLSEAVYSSRSVSAAAVAAHECGHAIQHNTAYSMLQLRSALVPVVQIAANLQQYLLLGALGLFGMSGNSGLLMLTIAVFGITALFALVTLPVEFDASRRALVWLNNRGITRGAEYDGAKDALHWAAMTYVAAALSSLAMLLYLVMRFMGSRD